MPTYYAEFSFRGKKVVKIDASDEQEALKIAQQSMDSPDGPASGLAVESSWWNFDMPRLVDDFSTRVRRQSERLRDLCNVQGRSVLSDHLTDKAPQPHQNRSASEGQTYYFCVPFTGQAVLQIMAGDEEKARAAAQSSSLNLGPKRIEPPLVSYSYQKGEPVLVKPDLT